MQDSIWYIKLVFPRHLILNRLRIRHYKNCCYVSIYLEFTVYTFDRLRIRHYVSIYLGLTIHKEILSNYIGIRCLVKHMFPFSMVIWRKKTKKFFKNLFWMGIPVLVIYIYKSRRTFWIWGPWPPCEMLPLFSGYGGLHGGSLTIGLKFVIF